MSDSSGYMDICEKLSKENAQLRDKIQQLKEQKFKRFNDDECWIYQGNGDDYPDSLVCPVVMSAQQLREFEQLRAELDERKASMRAVMAIERNEQEQLRAELEKFQWVSIADDIPPMGENVLVAFNDPEITPEVDYVDACPEYGNEFFANCGDDVTHWMRIPPRGGKQ